MSQACGCKRLGQPAAPPVTPAGRTLGRQRQDGAAERRRRAARRHSDATYILSVPLSQAPLHRPPYSQETSGREANAIMDAQSTHSRYAAHSQLQQQAGRHNQACSRSEPTPQHLHIDCWPALPLALLGCRTYTIGAAVALQSVCHPGQVWMPWTLAVIRPPCSVTDGKPRAADEAAQGMRIPPPAAYPS
jgi:hypothetical protein